MAEIVACTHLSRGQAPTSPRARPSRAQVLKAYWWFTGYFAEQLANGRSDYPIGVNNRYGELAGAIQNQPSGGPPPSLKEDPEEELVQFAYEQPSRGPNGCLGESWDEGRQYSCGERCQYEGLPYLCLAEVTAPGTPPPHQLQTPKRAGDWRLDPLSVTLSAALVCNLPALRFNPLAVRLCEVFCERGDQQLSFQEFVDMVSYTSRVAPRADKVRLLFNIYDADGDGFLTPSDLKQTLYAVLCGGYPWKQRLHEAVEARDDRQAKDSEMLQFFVRFLQALTALRLGRAVGRGSGLNGKIGSTITRTRWTTRMPGRSCLAGRIRVGPRLSERGRVSNLVTAHQQKIRKGNSWWVKQDEQYRRPAAAARPTSAAGLIATSGVSS